MWRTYKGHVQGTWIEGDPNVPMASWWNYPLLRDWVWRTVIIFDVSPQYAISGYRIGYKTHNGKSKIEDHVRHDQFFRMRIGYEFCIFFALSTDNREIPLRVVARTKLSDRTFQDAPLH